MRIQTDASASEHDYTLRNSDQGNSIGDGVILGQFFSEMKPCRGKSRVNVSKEAFNV
jgi:hypothetical protein